MRIMPVLIGVAVGVYVTWKVAAPLPASANSCLDSTDCGRPPVEVAASEAAPPGLRIALYDPALEPERRYDSHKPDAAWTSSAEAAPVVPDIDGRLGSVAAGLRQAVDFKLAPLDRPGAHGLCLVPEYGKRRCVAFIAARQE